MPRNLADEYADRLFTFDDLILIATVHRDEDGSHDAWATKIRAAEIETERRGRRALSKIYRFGDSIFTGEADQINQQSAFPTLAQYEVWRSFSPRPDRVELLSSIDHHLSIICFRWSGLATWRKVLFIDPNGEEVEIKRVMLR